ncbi:hypothetical protein [Clostridium sp. KNHs216]|uniref:hypothetical protein n=1 Tax=Clostridium sp. KNHs216 TaxID=1550235 RepID=UPI001153BE72|nr:hypothetical protein [Clostridium sp. KNHs216]TQI66249.1 hypothetical protein LY85_0910 [Clostridium sp. KNHs216]
MYKKVGEINRFSEIPWGKEIIITGSVGNGWYWLSKGKFVRGDNGLHFRDDCGVYSQFAPNDFISLNVLEKASYARKPEQEGRT